MDPWVIQAFHNTSGTMTSTGSRADGLSIAVLITAHNRRETTIRCLASLKATKRPDGCELMVVLVDDGSTDGTSEAVKTFMPEANLIEGTGGLYWAGGTRVAASQAATDCPEATHYLWLNDDVVLDPGAVETLCGLTKENPKAVIVGAVRDPDDGAISYSGLERRSAHPMRYSRVEPGDRPKPVETFNGNLVLIPVEVERLVGGLDAAFVHKYADLDYGHRVSEAGVSMLLAPGTLGACPSNHGPAGTSGLPENWEDLVGPKGLPPRLQARFLRRHGGPLWPLFFPIPYLRFMLGRILKRGDQTS